MSCNGFEDAAFAVLCSVVNKGQMRILFLSFFYPPDLSACSFRAGALIKQLMQRLPSDAHVEVLTTRPNRYASVETAAPDQEEHEKLTIKRIPLPAHRSGMADQARAYIAFDRAVMRYIRGRQYDLVFATSAKLMTGFLGARIANRLGVPLYLDIRDIFVDNIKDILAGVKGRLLLPIVAPIERYTVRSAAKVNLVSEGFKPYFEKRYPTQHFDFFTNGIDEEFLTEDWCKECLVTDGPVRVLYAGNLGEGQGMHRILPRLAKMAGDRYHFIVVGDGGRKEQLVQEIIREGVRNVELRSPVKRSELIQMYVDADVFFLHLNDYDAFATVLPSKLFEYAATGKPMLAGVSGYSADFLRREVENCGIFPPCDAEAGLAALRGLSLEPGRRTTFIQRYARTEIMERMADMLITIARPVEKEKNHVSMDGSASTDIRRGL
jgi:glycosyltransferase involved in cell wall biosynthesis